MHQLIIPPAAPEQPELVRPPMVYIERQLKWEYKQINRDMGKEKPVDEAELNGLGQDGWELTGIVQFPSMTFFYFKRPIDK